MAYSAKALHTESETQSGSGCVLSDLALFFLKIFLTFFPAFLTLKRLGVREGFGIGLSYKNTVGTKVRNNLQRPTMTYNDLQRST